MTKNNQKSIKKVEDHYLTEDYKKTIEILKKSCTSDDPDERVKNWIDDNKGKQIVEKNNQELTEIAIGYGLENNLSILEAVEKRYCGLAINLRKSLIQDFNCKTNGEKALVDMIVGAYMRNLSLTKKLVNAACADYTSATLNNYMSVMGKEVDRANRHFISALETLRAIKQPNLNVNVKSKNAFISENQQFNVNKKDDNKEINVSK